MSDTLEERVAKALTSDSITSVDLAALLEEVAVAIAATELEHNKTLDPLASPDADRAWKAIEHAAFLRDRLLSLRSRLEQRLQEVEAKEYETRWIADYEAHESKRDGLAAELRELYPVFEMKVADLFSRMQAFDAELSTLHQARPAGLSLRLLKPELIARGLEGFTINQPSLINEVKLPAFEPGKPQAWPPPQPSMAAAFAATVPGYDPRRFSADWAKDNERRAAVQRAEQKHMADYYARATREQQERYFAAVRERFR
jgi:hypothetical protein